MIHLFIAKGDRRPDVFYVFLGSSVVPGFWAVSDPSVPLRWEVLLSLAVAVALLLMLVTFRNFRKSWPETIMLLAVGSFYGYGLVSALNRDLDSGAEQIYDSQVLSKHVTRIRRHDYCYLRVAPWGPQAKSRDVLVSRSLYDSTRVGESVFIHSFSGGLHIPWFYASREQ